MSNKILNTRITQKIDISTNWEKAVNFTPLLGEIIVYSDLNKIKIGDGISNVNDLLFANASITISETEPTDNSQLWVDLSDDSNADALTEIVNRLDDLNSEIDDIEINIGEIQTELDNKISIANTITAEEIQALCQTNI